MIVNSLDDVVNVVSTSSSTFYGASASIEFLSNESVEYVTIDSAKNTQFIIFNIYERRLKQSDLSEVSGWQNYATWERIELTEPVTTNLNLFYTREEIVEFCDKLRMLML